MGGFSFGDLFQFEKMVAPAVLKVVYWIGLIGIALYLLFALGLAVTTMGYSPLTGLGMIVGSVIGACFGVLMWRIIIEVYMVLFGIHQRLGEVRDALKGGTTDTPAE
ncbi:DUF4282 domain-containing protein [Aurantiacibacter gilvus]|uniref:DUF4282 domain-containing protein n=1 Tax=Aurantiacibacter gilvus TaxID=3139141 RepID=A0ABU9IJ31_9SPHN